MRIIERRVPLDEMLQTEALTGVAFTGEAGGHQFVITALRNKEPVALTGSVSGMFIGPDGAGIELDDATIDSQGRAVVTMKQACYSQRGPFGIRIFHAEDGGKLTVIYSAAGFMDVGEPDTVYDPGNKINVAAIEAKIQEMDQAVSACNAAADAALAVAGDVAVAGTGTETLTLTNYDLINCTVSASATLTVSGTTYQSRKIPRNLMWDSISITANSTGATYATFVTSAFPSTITSGADISGALATGETGRHEIATGATVEFKIPADTAYIIITVKSTSNRTPESVNVSTFVNNAAQDALTFLPNVIASEFNQANAYQIGDYVSFSGKLYCAKFAVPANTAFSTTNFAEVKAGDKLIWDANNIPLGLANSISSVLDKITGCRGLVFVPGQRRAANDKTVIDITRVVTDTDLSKNMVTAVTACQPGDVYTIRAYGASGYAGAAICLLNANFEGIYVESWNALFNGEFTVPESITVSGNAEVPAYLIVNNNLNSNANYYAYKGTSLAPLLTDAVRNVGSVTAQSCDDLGGNAIYFVSQSGGSLRVPDFPINGPGWLFNSSVSSQSMQIAFPWDSTKAVQYRTKKSGVWGEWVTFVGGGGDTYNNTYNITTSPTITTDANGWLQAIDDEETAEADATDMTGAIMSMLNDTGYCHLGPGVFFVSGNIDVPNNGVLEGCGNSTVIKLLTSVTSGYTVRVRQLCQIKNLSINGQDNTYWRQQTTIGTRHGIYYVSNADGTGESTTPGYYALIEGCKISDFSGSGVYQSNTGGGCNQGIAVVDCFITRCFVGINIDYYSEYCKYTNDIVYACRYGCMNNGGNNVFTGCTFQTKVGFVIDNSSGTKRNNAHGSCVGCTFNHIDSSGVYGDGSGGGDAIVIKDVVNGFIFTGCQIWYGEIRLNNARGIAFSDCQIGGVPMTGTPLIEVLGNYPAFFSGCIFHSQPTLTVGTSGSKFVNCWLDEDGSAVSPS